MGGRNLTGNTRGTYGMTARYIFALSLIALLSITAYYSLSNVIETEETSAAVVNVSGRQRMLSQRIAHYAHTFADKHYSISNDENLKPLLDAINLMEKSHEGLVYGDPALNLPGNPSPKVRSMYFDSPMFLDRQVRKYISEARVIINTPDNELSSKNPQPRYIFSAAKTRLINSLDAMVKQYQIESEVKVAKLHSFEKAVLAITLSVLLMEALFIFRPMVRRVHQKTRELISSEQKTRAIVTTVGEGIITTGQDLRIRLVNQELCKIFGYTEDELIGRNITVLIPEKYRAAHLAGVKRYLTEKTAKILGRRLELEGLRKDEAVFPLEVRVEEAFPQEIGERLFTAAIRDITERKKAEEALSSNEEKYRLLFSNMLDSFALHEIVVDENNKPVDYVFLEVNDAFETMTGLKRTDIIGKKVTEALPGIENDPADWIGLYGKVALTGEVVRFEQYSESLGKWYSVYAYKPQQNQFAVIFEDITQRKKAEEAIRESEEKFRNLVENSFECICHLDVNGRYLYMNPSGIRLNELESMEDILGVDCTENVKEEFRSVVNEALDLARKGKVMGIEYASYSNKGREMWWESFITPVKDNKGVVVSLMKISRDVTERKLAEEVLMESEEKYRDLFEKSKDAVYITSRDGKYIDINRAALDLFGYTKEEMLELDVLKTYVNPDDREKFQEEIEKTGYVRDYEIQFQKKGGVKMDCLLTSSVRKGTDGSILGYQGIIRDITQDKILQQQLIQSEKLSSIGTFVAGVAHELNNPLTAVSLYSESLKEYDL
ncbi:MAG: PAS domain S-box protein, partial [Candidatus Desulfatibia sp.]|uniref:PAS domain S-box protein n=1 Tax=Candidatus Desulfatibia sp. TaxID=3101189 RepID=UPI002F2F81E2